MRSSREIPGDPTALGAGVLDITGALLETGTVDAAPSPKMARCTEGPVLIIEATSQLWGAEEWSAGFLWAESVEDYDPLFVVGSAGFTLSDD